MKFKIIVGLMAAFGVLGAWGYYNYYKLNKLNFQLNLELTQSKLEIGKSHTQLGNAQKNIKLLDKQLQAEINKNKELITKYGELLAQYNSSGGGVGSSNESNGEIIISNQNFIPATIYIARTETQLDSFNPPIKFEFSDGRLKISNSIMPLMDSKSSKLISEFSYDLNLRIMAQLVETINSNGAINNYVNLFEIDDAGQKLANFKITKFESTVQDLRKAHFSLFNPKIDIGILAFYNGGFNYAPDIGLSLSSYGLTKNDIEWRFVRLGIAPNSNDINFSISPVMWNAASKIPLLSNLWLSPDLVYGMSSKTFGAGIILGVVL